MIGLDQSCDRKAYLRRGRAILPLLLALAAAGVAASLILWLAPPRWSRDSLRDSVVPPSPLDRVVPDFTLTDQRAKPVSLADLKGKIWVAGFIFTRCHMTCPLVTATMASLRDKLSDDVVFVSFSVDPRHDTPEVLAEYAKNVKADPSRWHFLTGDQDEIYRLIRDGFQFAVEQNPDPRTSPGELVTHSNRLVVVDRDGVARYSYNCTDPAAVAQLERIVQRLRSRTP